MKKTVKIALIVAAALICAGLILGGIAHALGARLQEPVGDNLLQFGTFGVTIDASAGMEWNTDYASDGTYSIETERDGLLVEEIHSLDLGWTAGRVEIVVGDTERIVLEEESGREITEKYALRYGVKAGVLYVRYCTPGKLVENMPEKNLTVTIPRSLAEGMEALHLDGTSAAWSFRGIAVSTLDLDSTSGGLTAEEMTVRSADLDTVSGDILLVGSISDDIEADSTSGAIEIENNGYAAQAEASTTSGWVSISGSYGELKLSSTSGDLSADVTADSVDAETISGAVKLTGSYSEIDVNTTSGAVSVQSEISPAEIDIETTSGGVELAVPSDSGFTLDFDTASGDLQCDLALTMKGEELYCGDGRAEYSISTTSGDLKLTPVTTLGQSGSGRA